MESELKVYSYKDISELSLAEEVYGFNKSIFNNLGSLGTFINSLLIHQSPSKFHYLDPENNFILISYDRSSYEYRELLIKKDFRDSLKKEVDEVLFSNLSRIMSVGLLLSTNEFTSDNYQNRVFYFLDEIYDLLNLNPEHGKLINYRTDKLVFINGNNNKNYNFIIDPKEFKKLLYSLINIYKKYFGFYLN